MESPVCLTWTRHRFQGDTLFNYMHLVDLNLLNYLEIRNNEPVSG